MYASRKRTIFQYYFLALASALVYSACGPMSSTTAQKKGGESIMKPIKIEQTTLAIQKGVTQIMPSPQPDTLLTLSLNDALTLLVVRPDGIEYRELARDFLRYVSDGEFIFLPPISNTVVGYTQFRRVVLFNLESHQPSTHLICDDLGDSIADAHFHGGSTFYIVLRRFSDGSLEPKYILRKYSIDWQNIQLQQELPLPSGAGIAYRQDTIFVHNQAGVLAYNPDLKETSHPLTDFIRETELKPEALFVHPDQSFAIVREGSALSVIDWRKKATRIPLGNTDAKWFDASPDGNWLIYWTSSSQESLLFALRVNPESISFLDPPILLGRFTEMPMQISRAWVPNPQSYAAIDLPKQQLLLWRLPQ
jgi:hypothetical protein